MQAKHSPRCDKHEKVDIILLLNLNKIKLSGLGGNNYLVKQKRLITTFMHDPPWQPKGN